MKTTRWLIACFVLAVFLLPRYAPAEDAQPDGGESERCQVVSVTEHPRFGTITVRRQRVVHMFSGWPGTKGDFVMDSTEVVLSEKIREEITALLHDRFLNSENLVASTLFNPKKSLSPAEYRLNNDMRKLLADGFQSCATLSSESYFKDEGTSFGSHPMLLLGDKTMSVLLGPGDGEAETFWFVVILDDENFTYDDKNLWVYGELNEKFVPMLETFEAACTEEKRIQSDKLEPENNSPERK